MNSPFSKLILDMQQRIADEIPAIKFIDLDTNQLEDGSNTGSKSFAKQPGVLYPCLLLDFPETVFTQNQTHQDGTVQVQMKLATQTIHNSSENTPLEVREQALEPFELAHLIYLKFQYWNNNGTLSNVFIRKSQTVEKRIDGIKVLLINFECTFTDASAEG